MTGAPRPDGDGRPTWKQGLAVAALVCTPPLPAHLPHNLWGVDTPAQLAQLAQSYPVALDPRRLDDG